MISFGSESEALVLKQVVDALQGIMSSLVVGHSVGDESSMIQVLR